MKVEQLPQEQYAEQRQLVLDGQDYLLASDDAVTRNYALAGTMTGLAVQGFDRLKLEGGVLGIICW